ncbi:MAG TPA: nuclear transport factor 2 family protein [Xanthomonadaceae bacterium]|jgi:hypothetical protein|nr:nuclear transport factor 2 family protein [Xanthomonadaceae bacterium]
MAHDSILSTLRALECELHESGTRHDRQRLVELLHPDFHEFGRSGASYTRADILEHLLAEPEPGQQVHAQDFVVRELAASAFLLTYRSATVAASGILERHANRSSVWRLGPSGWQVVFHQGTPADAFAREQPC